MKGFEGGKRGVYEEGDVCAAMGSAYLNGKYTV